MKISPNQIVLLILILFSISFFSDKINAGSDHRISIQTYKTVDTIRLNLNIHYPEKMKRNTKLPAVIFFFGGGWKRGTTAQFEPHCRFLASQGIIGITAEYRVETRHGSTPQDAISDAKSAIRWIRANAEALQIDGDRLVAAGGSAGGHLAACTATMKGFNDPADDLSIDPVPSALILFNPVVLIEDRFMDIFGGTVQAREASPIFFITENMPPTLIFHGTDDKTALPSTVLEFQKKMNAVGERCEVILFGGERHAFFNKGKNNDRPYHQTLVLMKQFLIEEGLLVE